MLVTASNLCGDVLYRGAKAPFSIEAIKMNKMVLLNSLNHIDYKVDLLNDPTLTEINQIPLVVGEIEYAALEFPIFITKLENSWQLVALLGLDQENLFVKDQIWIANYCPAQITRGPFYIRTNKKLIDGKYVEEPLVFIDESDVRVNAKTGKSIYFKNGGQTPFFDSILHSLRTLHLTSDLTKNFLLEIVEKNLITPVNLKVSISDTEHYQLDGFYSIDLSKLYSLDGEKIEDMNRRGVLRICYLLEVSRHNISRLVNMKNRIR